MSCCLQHFQSDPGTAAQVGRVRCFWNWDTEPPCCHMMMFPVNLHRHGTMWQTSRIPGNMKATNCIRGLWTLVNFHPALCQGFVIHLDAVHRMSQSFQWNARSEDRIECSLLPYMVTTRSSSSAYSLTWKPVNWSCGGAGVALCKLLWVFWLLHWIAMTFCCSKLNGESGEVCEEDVAIASCVWTLTLKV